MARKVGDFKVIPFGILLGLFSFNVRNSFFRDGIASRASLFRRFPRALKIAWVVSKVPEISIGEQRGLAASPKIREIFIDRSCTIA